MRILLTGASGFAGQHIARRLLEEGHDLHLFLRDPEGRPDSLSGATVHEGTLADPRAIAKAAEDCEAVVHCAGETSHRASPEALGWINVAGTENVVNAAQHVGVRRLVHISCTDVTLIKGPRVNWKEDRVIMQKPMNAYAQTKALSEEFVIGSGGLGSSGKAPFETVVLRPALLWGAGDTSQLPRLCAEGLDKGLSLFAKGENLIATTHVVNLAEAVHRSLTIEQAAGGLFFVLDRELTLSQDFYGSLSAAVGLPKPRRGLGLAMEYKRAALRRRLKQSGAWPSDVARRGQSHSFDSRHSSEVLQYEPPMSQGEGMAGLAKWAERVGGAKAIAALARPPAQDGDVAAQIEAASD